MATILVVAGTNGAGKSSLLGKAIELDGGTWFNPDAFTRRLQEDTGCDLATAQSDAWQYGKDRLTDAMVAGHDWAFETTLGGNTITALLREACALGHDVTVWYCGLESVELHIQRVAERVAHGGHHIDEGRIRTRYVSSRNNLLGLMDGLASLHVYDNSLQMQDGFAEPRLLLEMDRNELHYPVTVEDYAATPAWAQPLVERAVQLHPECGLA